jgi:RND family efflux transporter MFP subunit
LVSEESGDNVSDESGRLPAGEQSPRTRKLRRMKLWIASTVIVAAAGTGWVTYSHHQAAAANAGPATLPEVVVSKPLIRDIDKRLGFLGQFSAVEQVEFRAQVGGTLAEIHFKDGDIVHAGDLLFVIDPRPYEYRVAQATAQLESATARLELANRQFARAQALKKSDVGTTENVDQRTSDQQAAQAAIDDAKARLRDAQFDLEHCRITAPFTGRIGTHLVSVGNLIAGSRTATSPTTLLATIVSVDPIYLDFDMSESDYLAFSRDRAKRKDALADRVEIGLSDETDFGRQGTLDFVDNTLDRSSGTLHARATIANSDFLLTPGEFARVRLVVGAPAPSLLIPDAAVLPDQSEHLVLTVTPDGTVAPKRVQIGDIRGGLRVIRSGLEPNDRVIIEGLPYAAPGSKVEAQDGAIRYAATSQD